MELAGGPHLWYSYFEPTCTPYGTHNLSVGANSQIKLRQCLAASNHEQFEQKTFGLSVNGSQYWYVKHLFNKTSLIMINVT